MKRALHVGSALLFLSVGTLKLVPFWELWTSGLPPDKRQTIRAEHVIALSLELAVGVLFLLPRTRFGAAVGATVLGIVFCAYSAIRGPYASPCGCLGPVPLGYSGEFALAAMVLSVGIVNLVVLAGPRAEGSLAPPEMRH